MKVKGRERSQVPFRRSPIFIEKSCMYSAGSCILQSFAVGKDRKRSFSTTIIARVYLEIFSYFLCADT
uniref:Uncharacterized protein n=1 Tax=Pyxicephalus adspersus TaxID=30357 RepID=A0A499QI69_PYXAD|nr:hypothetical protein maker-240M17-exonerate_protein2genome-gene-0.10 [Pyxicephalus adspersus]